MEQRLDNFLSDMVDSQALKMWILLEQKSGCEVLLLFSELEQVLFKMTSTFTGLLY